MANSSIGLYFLISPISFSDCVLHSYKAIGFINQLDYKRYWYMAFDQLQNQRKSNEEVYLHTTTPNLSQDGAQAIEDSYTLSSVFLKMGATIELMDSMYRRLVKNYNLKIRNQKKSLNTCFEMVQSCKQELSKKPRLSHFTPFNLIELHSDLCLI